MLEKPVWDLVTSRNTISTVYICVQPVVYLPINRYEVLRALCRSRVSRLQYSICLRRTLETKYASSWTPHTGSKGHWWQLPVSLLEYGSPTLKRSFFEQLLPSPYHRLQA